MYLPWERKGFLLKWNGDGFVCLLIWRKSRSCNGGDKGESEERKRKGEERKERVLFVFWYFFFPFFVGVGGVGIGSNESMQNIQRRCSLCFLHSAGWASFAVQGVGVAVDPPHACEGLRSVLTRVILIRFLYLILLLTLNLYILLHNYHY